MRPDLRFLLAHPAHLIALGFGSGLAPKAPGTAGTLLGLPLFWAITAIAPDLPNQLILIAAGFLLGIWACARTGRALGVADHGGMVWDEIVAFALVLLFTPAGWMWMLAAFGLFRLFDIVKPWPIRFFDTRLKNGFGVMFDDLLAAGYAIACLQLAAHFL
ncbi:MAG: phosphatidylglycerophosphatase A [Hydrogenophilales bacterium 16-64-46]|nr:MAG: phosphatidylglycerophosphatase A [Hydrogenophilales bacterium 12-64-13]OYZ06226.1 MAG: phosphatidylglycerophosphatase A [Hydrogenophilales bacterium 16-64-46]OZA38875.1 MAG: phosphatidylglycerophosphatase A [Hydrogenophilales bacterium 17-64-34]HQS99481.1 phosphatidylglycerophosphatase A [Thiobacillus sp.]